MNILLWQLFLGLFVFFTTLLIIPLITKVFSVGLNFVLRRKDIDLPSTYTLFCKINKLPRCSAEPLYFGVGFMLWVISFIFTIVFYALHSDIEVNILYLLILGIPHTLRFVVDLIRGLRLNNKTGDLEEINSLRKRLDELESKE